MIADKLSEMKKILLDIPEGSMHPQLMEMVSKWDEPAPTPIQAFEVFDKYTNLDKNDKLIATVLKTAVAASLNYHKQTMDEVLKQVTWRE